MAVLALLRLAKLTGRQDLFVKAEATLRLFRGLMAASPLAAGQMLVALDFYLGPVREFAVVSDKLDSETAQALHVIRSRFDPNKVIALKTDQMGQEAENAVPLLAGKTTRGKVTTYICENFACREPLVGPEALGSALG